VEPSIEAIIAGKGNGDSHGGARPRLDRLRRNYSARARMADPTSISGMHWSERKAEEGWQGHEESWPCGALTPARSDKAVVGENGDFILTKAKLARRWGG